MYVWKELSEKRQYEKEMFIEINQTFRQSEVIK